MLKTASLSVLFAAILASVALAASADAVWRDVLDAPATKSPLAPRMLLNGLARAGDRTVAVGQRGHALYSDDLGTTWKQADVPVSSDLVAVSFPTAKSGWAVGHDGVVLHTADGGATWTRQLDGRTVGSVLVDYYTHAAANAGSADSKRADALLADAKKFAAQGAENPLLDVWFENESTGFVVGAFGLILKTVDGGATWEPLLHAVDNPKSLHFYAVRGIGADRYIAGEQGLLLKFDPATNRFRALELPYKGTLFGIVGNARAVLVHGLRGTVLRSVDGGQNWQPVSTGLQVGMTGSTVDSDGRILIVSQAGHVLVSRDDGASLQAIKIERPIPAAAVAVAASKALIVAGPRGVQMLPLQ